MSNLIELAENALLELKELKPLFDTARSRCENESVGQAEMQQVLAAFDNISTLKPHKLLALLLGVQRVQHGSMGAPGYKRDIREAFYEMAWGYIRQFAPPGSSMWWAVDAFAKPMLGTLFDRFDLLFPPKSQHAFVEWFVRHQHIVLGAAGVKAT